MNLALAKNLVATLPVNRPGLFNPYQEHCAHDAPGNGPRERLHRLAQHLDCAAQFVLLGEAPGYQGCRYSGVAFTSERLIIQGAIPRVAGAQGPRLSTRHIPFSEPSATIVWGALQELGIADSTVLWNAVQLHPFKDGNVWSNRTPTDAELKLGQAALQLLQGAFPTARLVAVGQKADATLKNLGITPAACVRHPANGGASEFRAGLKQLLAG